MWNNIKKHPFLWGIWIFAVLVLSGIVFIWIVFNSGITNEGSSFIDRTQMETEQEDIEAQLNQLINQ